MTRGTAARVALVSTVAALVAGCGSGAGTPPPTSLRDALSHEEYKAHFSAARAKLGPTFFEMGRQSALALRARGVTRTNAPVVYAKLARITSVGARRIRGFADQLNALALPHDAVAPNKQLALGLLSFPYELDAFVDSLRAGEIVGAAQLWRRLDTLGSPGNDQAIREAMAALEAAGYEIDADRPLMSSKGLPA